MAIWNSRPLYLILWLKRNLRNKNKAKKDDHKSWAIFRENCSGERSKYEHLFRAFIGIKLRNELQISEKIKSYNIVWVIILTEYNIDYNSVYLQYEYEYYMYSYFNMYIMQYAYWNICIPCCCIGKSTDYVPKFWQLLTVLTFKISLS